MSYKVKDVHILVETLLRFGWVEHPLIQISDFETVVEKFTYKHGENFPPTVKITTPQNNNCQIPEDERHRITLSISSNGTKAQGINISPNITISEFAYINENVLIIRRDSLPESLVLAMQERLAKGEIVHLSDVLDINIKFPELRLEKITSFDADGKPLSVHGFHFAKETRSWQKTVNKIRKEIRESKSSQ